MNYDYSDCFVAESQLQVTNSFGFSHNFLTIWKGITVMFVYDSLSNKIISLFYPDVLKEDEVDFLSNIAYEYLISEEDE